MQINDLPSLFFGLRRASIRYIVIHTTEGVDSRTWLTLTGALSAHYLVQEDQVYRLVGEEWTAWHAGKIVGTPTTPLYDGTNPNEQSIGIEMEGYAANLLSPATLTATAALIRDIRSRRGDLPLVNHAELSPDDRSDPGVQNRAALDALLKEEIVDDETKQAILQTARDTRELLGMMTALAKDSLPEWLDRLGDGRDVATGESR